MASFLQSIFNRFSGKSGAPKVAGGHLGAFGKHPGWNDHLDDQGLDTAELINLKRQIYVGGMTGNIDAGAWDKLVDDQRLEKFRHVFLWRSADDVIVGRMWSSSDGKGRTKYPMIVCYQGKGLSVPWLLDYALPRLEKIEADCCATADAGTVKRILDLERDNVRAAVAAHPEAQLEPTGFANPLAALSRRPEMGADQRGLMCVLYQIDREMAAFRPSAKNDRGSRVMTFAPRHIRVPACGSNPGEVLLLWTRFLLTQLEPSSSIMLIHPLGQDWVDVLVGEPGVREFFCVRATPKVIPLTTDIPYNLDDAFVNRSREAIAVAGRA